MIINNKSSINSLVFILNMNWMIYIISQTFNNTIYIFNILPININNNSIQYFDKCNDDYNIINIYSSIIVCISLAYFVYKCHYLRLNYTNILHFIGILLLNIGFNLFNIIFYYCFFNKTLVEKDCNISSININNINIYMYFNLVNIGFLGCNMIVYIYNLKLINQLDN